MRRRRRLDAAPVPRPTASLPVSELQDGLVALLLPVRPTGVFDLGTADAMMAWLASAGSSPVVQVSEDRRTVFVTPEFLRTFDETVQYARAIIGSPAPTTRGTWGWLLLQLAQMRALAVPLADRVRIAAQSGVRDRAFEARAEQLLQTIERLSQRVADWIDGNEDLKHAMMTRGAEVRAPYPQLIAELRSALPRYVPSGSSALGTPAVGWIVLVGIVVVGVAATSYFWTRSASASAEADRTEAETELEAVRTAREALERGLPPDQVARLLDPAARMRASAQRRTGTSAWLWGVLLVGGAVWLLSSSRAAPARERVSRTFRRASPSVVPSESP